jgi:hypothetical protein
VTVYPRHRNHPLTRLHQWLTRPQPAGQHRTPRTAPADYNPLTDAVRADIGRRTHKDNQ